MLHADLRYDYVRTWFARLAEAPLEEIERLYAEMEADGRAAVAATGAAVSEIVVGRAADMRYVGQEHAVAVDLPAALFAAGDRAAIKRRFDEVHGIRYGTSAPAEPAELVSLRATVSGLLPKPPMVQGGEGGTADPRPVRDAAHLFLRDRRFRRHPGLCPGRSRRRRGARRPGG